MLRSVPPVAVLLCLLLGAAPAYAQETDTTTTAPTTDAAPPDATAPTADTSATPAPVAPGPRRGQATQAAQTAAEEWLALTDAGAFGESWAAADSTLRARISREDWIDQGVRAHSRLDTLRSRRLTRTQYRDAAPQLPGGSPVVVLRYASEYTTGPVLEAVITTRRDTAWTVAGYRMVSARLAADSTRAAADSTEERASLP